tara:strand:- start:9792 stop:12467 length:2676 start_codon:yes stop_codon:yes gene_type:complete
MYFDEPIDTVLKNVKSSSKGITKEDASKRLEEFGPNILKGKKKISAIKIFINQFKNIVVGILIVALIISIIVPIYENGLAHISYFEFIDAIVIFIIIVLNAIMGFIQEFRAEKAIEALNKMASLKAKVIRSGKETVIEASDIVPGDIILLDVGDKVPADSRIIEEVNLKIQEAMLTGESQAVSKNEKIVSKDAVLADRKNMVFSGTIVTMGRAKCVAVNTGMNSEMGKIAKMLDEVEITQTPMQKKLEHLGKVLAAMILVICIVVFAEGVITGSGTVLELFIVAVSLAVAAIPEGLPAVVTIALAFGVERMAKNNALMRKLPSVETLGSTTVICTDKTGTLTRDEMTVEKLFVNKKVIDVSGVGYEIKGDFSLDGKNVDGQKFTLLLKIGLLCNDAKIDSGDVIGDPTEGALIVSAGKAGLKRGDLLDKEVRIKENGFDSDRKRMSTIHKIGSKKVMYCKGAPEVMLGLCVNININGKVKKITASERNSILKQNETFAKKALRVLAFAYKEKGELEEKGMTFVGLQAMMDPPRQEAKDAIATCKKAGIKVVMITGDHAITAKAVANELGIVGESLDGEKLNKMEHLDGLVEKVSIYSRVDPKHKLLIVEAFKKRGDIVAMTGDGVNDAPALKKADIGVAMGKSGTDVAKESADMILTDDNFASIVNAVREGRGIYDNIKKFIFYLLSSNFGEVLTIFVAILLFTNSEGHSLVPLLALHILWVNLVTDGLPALALSVDPYDPEIMEKLPKNPKSHVITKLMMCEMLFVGILITAGTLFVFSKYLDNLPYARTMAFTTLVMFQLFNVFNSRSMESSIFKLGIFSNVKLIGAIIVSLLLQFVVIYTPLNIYFKAVPLVLFDWVLIVGVALSVIVVLEVYKLIRNVVKHRMHQLA